MRRRMRMGLVWGGEERGWGGGEDRAIEVLQLLVQWRGIRSFWIPTAVPLSTGSCCAASGGLLSAWELREMVHVVVFSPQLLLSRRDKKDGEWGRRKGIDIKGQPHIFCHTSLICGPRLHKPLPKPLKLIVDLHRFSNMGEPFCSWRMRFNQG